MCPEGATHTSPGHRPGNRIQENQCVLKEHRIGRVGAEGMKAESRKRKAEMAGFSFSVLRISAFSFPNFSFSSIRRDLRPEGRAEPRSEARNLCGVPSERGVVFPGGFPGLAPWAGMRCPYRAWIENTVGSPVTETPSGRRIGNTVGALYRKHRRCSVSETLSVLRIGNPIGSACGWAYSLK